VGNLTIHQQTNKQSVNLLKCLIENLEFECDIKLIMLFVGCQYSMRLQLGLIYKHMYNVVIL